MGEMQGRRVREAENDALWPPDVRGFANGDYALVRGQVWFRDPVGNVGRVGHHTITEHEDGTITVDPSILDTGGEPGDEPFHGWLRRGVWTW